MNAPLPESVRQALERVTLDDKYRLSQGRAFMSGVQALVRLPMLQRERDALQGKNTAGFISGYRGSPLGSYDQALWKAKDYLQAQHIVFQPGVNEELAATALWGTQQLGFTPPQTHRFDGVFGIWYGKGPGVDRCADVFKHANMAGTTPWGGVIAVAGDDHVAKSSTAAHQSDHIFKACGSPVFFPASVQEILDLGVHAFAMSRFSGVWAGMKTIQEIVESSASVEIDAQRVRIITPEFEMPPGGLHIRWPDDALSQEARLFDYKWYAALAYIRANRLNHTVIQGPQDRLGLIASGKAYNDTRQALSDLGLDLAQCQRLGIRVHKVGVVWPLEAQLTREFATGLKEILVIEEKRQVIEYQLKEELYNWRSDVRPNVLGKFNEVADDHTGGEWSMPNPSRNTLLRANADLSPALIAQAIAQRLLLLGVDEDTRQRLQAHLDGLKAKEQAMAQWQLKAERQPWFCSGCPHNTSTRVPEGSRAMAGIGCHFMAVWMDRATVGFTQMGGEGVPWVGQQPFVTERHVFANLGDGTYFHSGLLAIRQSVTAGVNITYKILYNDAVAMTGGQPVGERPEGHSVLQIAQSMQAEGVRQTTIVTDEPDKYAQVALPAGVAVFHRDQLDAIQKQMREIAGTTIIIYDQTCATEKRRRRKRGQMVDPAVRVVINEQVCEGCGDCGVQSNCLSVEPLSTPLGRKRTINQSTCNKDFSCVKGFCPSFVSVLGGSRQAAPQRTAVAWPQTPLPQPTEPSLAHPWGIVVAGVGGTGVITIGQLLGVAAHLEGKGVVTQDAAGLAQKGGATWSHVILAADQSALHTTRVSTACADLVLGCDPIVSAHRETVLRMRSGRTHVALNHHSTPTAAFVKNANWQDPSAQCETQLRSLIGPERLGTFDANAVAQKALGDTIFINPMILGYAWQKGWIPLSQEALLRAIELNEVAVDKNKQAFEWGRQCAHDYAAVEKALGIGSAQTAQPITWVPQSSFQEELDRRIQHLTQYQNAHYAQQYAQDVTAIQAAEALHGRTEITQVVMHEWHRLLAYKDEYEVARLHTDPAFLQRIQQQFGAQARLQFHLAPPLWAKRNERGELQKQAYGAWMLWVFKGLRHFKWVRGTWCDPFGYTHERQKERELIDLYRQTLRQILALLQPSNAASPANQSAEWARALQLAQQPQGIKGYGHVKARQIAQIEPQWRQLLGQP